MAFDHAEETEHALEGDLAGLTDALREDTFARELYRGLAGNALSREESPDRRVAMSWRRAEEVVNGLRERVGEERLTLAQTGGEGDLSERVERALADLGWRGRPLDPTTHDSDHVAEPNSPPPPGQGERDAPVEPPEAWRRADEEADRR